MRAIYWSKDISFSPDFELRNGNNKSDILEKTQVNYSWQHDLIAIDEQ